MLITFEGIDGSGKSTQTALLETRLAEAGYVPVHIREPGGTETSERIRELLLDADLKINPFPEMLLFSAARAQLVTEVIRPALEANKIVVCDRFYDSTIAYQGAGRGVADPDWLLDFQKHVTGGLSPDRTYLIRLSEEESFRRRMDRSEDRMEQAGRIFRERVIDEYDRLAHRFPDRFVLLDGRLSVQEIHEQIWADLAPRLGRA